MSYIKFGIRSTTNGDVVSPSNDLRSRSRLLNESRIWHKKKKKLQLIN